MYKVKRCKECGDEIHIHYHDRRRIVRNTCEHLKHLQGENIKESDYSKYFRK